MADQRQALAQQVLAKLQPPMAEEIPASIAAPAEVLEPVAPEIVPVDVLAPPPAAAPTTSMGYPAPIIGQPLPPAPMQIPEPQATEVAQAVGAAPAPPILTADQIEAASMPSQEEVDAQVDVLSAPARAERAQAYALDKIDNLRLETEKRQAEREAAVTAQFAELDSQVRNKSFNEIMQKGSFGEKLRTGIAIMMGAISQGLSGAKSNPVIDFMNTQADQQAAKDKLTLDQKNMLKQQVYQQGMLEIQKLENATNNAYRKDQLALQRQELAQKSAEFTAKLRADLAKRVGDASKWSGKALTKEQDASLSVEERRNVVHLPDGRRVLAQSYEDANKFKEVSGEINSALESIAALKELSQKGSKFSLNDRARANSLVTKIVGGLRLPYTGPGVMTDNEREMLIKTLGNPLAAFSLRSIEHAKLDQVADDLMSNLQTTAKVRGVNEQVTPEKFYNVGGQAVKESALIKAYQQKMPGLSADKIKSAIRKSIPEL